MTHPHLDRAIALCGTQQPDGVREDLAAGPMKVEFDHGSAALLKVGGVEVLRVVGFLVRDENWGTYAPRADNLRIDQRGDGFTVSFHACASAMTRNSYDATIEGTQEAI